VGQKKVKTIDLDKEKTSEASKAKDKEKAPDKKSVSRKARKKSGSTEKKAPDKSAKSDKSEKLEKKTKPKNKLRSKRYRKLRTYIDRQKFYSLNDAVKLLCKIANSKIDETVELDILSRRKDAKGKVKLVHKKKPVEFATEKKAPLLHMVIGKISLGEQKLLKNLEELIGAVGPKSIKKAVLSATHSPGIKLEIKEIEKNKK
jgi:ribosomal protein L1